MPRRLIDADALYEQIAKKEELARQRVLDTPSRMPNGDFNPSAIRYATQLDERTQMKFMIADAPTIDPTPHWIPCNERLPENMQRVNITWVNRDPEPYYMSIIDKPFTATGIYFKGKWYWDSVTCEYILGEYGENEIDEVDASIEIVAWMPMPEPYEVKE